ncbi:MAG: FAD:protein FMN transferase [Blastocatellia bacterium]
MAYRSVSWPASSNSRSEGGPGAGGRLILACLMAAVLFTTSLAHKSDGCRADISKPLWAARMHYVMGTMLEIQMPSIDSNGRLFAALFDIARHHDEVFSTFKPDSPVSRFNRLGRRGAPFPAPAEMIELASLSQRFSGQTKGAFDVTVGPLVRLWREAAIRKQWPRVDEIRAARGRVGSSLLAVDSKAQAITALSDGVELDFNGIAKGYCVDKMAGALRGEGVARAFINFGESSIYALGNDPDGGPWGVAVRDPRRPARAQLMLRLSDMAISSSGSYEHSSRVAGRAVNHIIDPRTGMPARIARAVTVVAPNATVAEALSKPLTILPVAEGLGLLAGFPGAEAIIFYRSGTGHWRRAMSRGMKKFVE